MVDESKSTWSEAEAVPTEIFDGPSQTHTQDPPPEDQLRRWMKLLGIVALAGALGYGVGNVGKPYVRRMIHGPAVELQKGKRVDVALRGDEPSKGPKDALVTIVVFSDYECPFCAKAEKSLNDFLEDWQGPPIRVIHKNYPLPIHEYALGAAHSAWAAHMQQKFGLMNTWLFKHRGNLDKLTDAELESMGLDVTKFKTDRDAPVTLQAVDDDRLAGGRIKIRATPSFVINGHVYTANWTQEAWEDVVNWELRAAKELVDQGVAPAQVLEQLVNLPAPAEQGAADKP